MKTLSYWRRLRQPLQRGISRGFICTWQNTYAATGWSLLAVGALVGLLLGERN